MNTEYTTKVTFLGRQGYGCRVFRGEKLLVEGYAETKDLIGPTFRDLLRTIDKCGIGDSFTSAARTRKFKEGNRSICVRHYWGGR